MTPTEQVVMEMWTELLGVPPASVHDDFFTLGAQSLTVVQFIARVQQTYGIELPVDELFAADFSAAETARLIDEALLDGIPDEQLAELLDELEGMSDEDVQTLLRES